MQASSERTWQVRLALMLMVGVAAAAACVVALMLWKAPVVSAQDEGGAPTGANFVVSCGFSHEKQVDPILDYGPSGTNPDGTPFFTKSDHMHHFFGNRTTDSNSTLQSLRDAALRSDHGTTCEPKPGKTFGDTAAYWIPKVSWKDSRGKVTPLKASQTFFYYRAGLKDPASVKPFPAYDVDSDGDVDGLKIVTIKGKNVEWRCQGGTWSPTPPTRCGDNGTLVVRIFFPDCLAVVEGSNPMKPLTDTADDPARFPDNDHRSHMVDAGSAGCPSDYPYPVPRLQTNFLFHIPTTRGEPLLATENNTGKYPTMHADFFNAWQEGTLEDLVARCINKAPFTASNPKPADCGS
jgi:hypothetical protein